MKLIKKVLNKNSRIRSSENENLEENKKVTFLDKNLEEHFDKDLYCKFHIDVAESSIDPKMHFLKHGVFEGRRIFENPTQVSKIIFVDGISNATSVYRIYNIVNSLKLFGVESEVMSVPFLFDRKYKINEYDLVILVRVAWNEKVRSIVKFCKLMGIPVIADFDDYIFEPDIVNKDIIDGLRDFNQEMIFDYLNDVICYRQTIEMCDCATFSTHFLMERAKDMGVNSHHIFNSLEVNFYGSALGWNGLEQNIQKKISTKRKNICYLSGSATHQKDFQQIVPVLSKILKENENVFLQIYGELDIDSYTELTPFSERIERFPLIPYSEYFGKLPEILINSYIVVAPLDVNSVFCHAKSELKYFEAAAFGVPVVASATDTYKKAIQNAVNGFVCSDEKDWEKNINLLLNDSRLYEKISKRARTDALTNYGSINLGIKALSTYNKILGEKKRKKIVTWLVPGPIPPESGGHNSILYAAKELVRREYDVRIRLTCDESGIEPSYDAIRYKFGTYEGIKLYAGIDELEKTDVAIATHYSTALALDKNREQARVCCYFIQDYEPYFNSIGTDYFKAEYTYHLGYKNIALGRWLSNMVDKHSGNSDFIDFWVDREKYYIDKSIKKKNNIVAFFARPSMPRRCYDLGVRALSDLYKKNQNVRIKFFGEPHFPDDEIDFPYEPLGVLDKDQLRSLYNESTIVLAFSTTNPSIATFEAMACGAIVVDLDVFNARDRHFGYPAILCPPLETKIADSINEILCNEEKIAMLSKLSKEFTDSMPTPEESIAKMIDYIESYLGDK